MLSTLLELCCSELCPTRPLSRVRRRGMRSVRCSAAHSRAIVDMLAIGCANQRLCGARSSAATASSL
jgi:hypothetical protein